MRLRDDAEARPIDRNTPLVRVKRVAAARYGGVFDNPTARRDFRVQMRGARTLVLFALYLIGLTAVALNLYSNIARGGGDLVSAQRQLTQFYTTIMGTIATVIALVIPAIAATSVVAEKQRRSLDVLFTTPETPANFLLGKIVSSTRFTAMLIALSLPVTAASVVIGGAGVFDVLGGFAILLLSGMVISAINLLVSALSSKPVQALFVGYLATGAYLTGVGVLAASLGRFEYGGLADRVVPFLVQLSPFTASSTAASWSGFFGLPLIPNLILTTLFSLALVRFLVSAGAAALAPDVNRALPKLRLAILGWIAAGSGWAGWALATDVPSGADVPSAFATLTMIAFGASLPVLGLAMPFLATYGLDGSRRQQPDGLVSRRLFSGRPSSGLTYALGILATSVVAGAVGYAANGGTAELFQEPGTALSYIAYAVAFWTFFWSIGRLMSAHFMTLRESRAATFAAFLAVVVGPLPLIAYLQPNSGNMRGGLWDLYILRPLSGSGPGLDWVIGLVFAAILAVLAFGITTVSESILARKLVERERRREARER